MNCPKCGKVMQLTSVEWNGVKTAEVYCCEWCGRREPVIRCEVCGAPGAERRHQMTAYVNKESNYKTLCGDCQDEADEYWKDMWNEYYSIVQQ